MITLTKSKFGIMKSCPRCFWWEMNKGLKRFEGPQSRLANAADDRIKNHFDRFRARGDLPPELQNDSYTGKLYPNQTLLNEWRLAQKGLVYLDASTGITLKGVFDDLLQEEEATIVLDYKTVSKNPKNFTIEKLKEDINDYDYTFQLELYTAILKLNGHKTKPYGYLLFYCLGELDSKGNPTFHTILVKINLDLSRIKDYTEVALRILAPPEPPQPGINKNKQTNKYEICGFCISNEERNNFNSVKYEEELTGVKRLSIEDIEV